MQREGRLQVYTGNGKGKTTAALGLALRAACSGMKVYIGQFMKGQDYSELCFPDRFPSVTMEQFGTVDFVPAGEKPSDKDMKLAERGFALIREAVVCGEFDVVIADEICVAQHMGLLRENSVLELASARPDHVELVFTGRYASDTLIKKADLVTEMMSVKHYYDTEKLLARRGIEN